MISDEGLVTLSQLRNIQYLEFSRTNSPISDEALQSLSRLTNLAHLGITHAKMTPEQQAALKNALPNAEIMFDGIRVSEPVEPVMESAE